MALDVFQENETAALADAQRFTRSRLPATFPETFETAWDNGVLFGQSVAFLNARNRAMEDLANEAFAKTRDERLRYENIKAATLAGPTGTRELDVYNDRVNKVIAENPEREASGFPAADLRALTIDDVDARGEQLARDARDSYKTMAAREKTWGGSFGMFGGSGASGVVDPVNVLTFPVAAPEALGILGTGAAWAAIAGGTQTAIEAIGEPYRERVDPEAANESVANIRNAALFGGGLGASIKALGTGWRYLKTKAGVELPRNVRDAGNVIESEAQIQETNPFRGPQAEPVHREALSKTVDDVVAGRPVDVERIVTPEMQQSAERRLLPILKARQAAIEAGTRADFLERESARLPDTMERLSEQQLADIRNAADDLDTGLAERQAALTAQLEKAKAAHAEQLGKVEQAKPIIENLQRLEGEIAAQTEAKNQTIDRLGSTSPEASAAFDRLDALRREHAAENNKLKKVQAGTAKLEKLARTVQERESALPLRQVTAEARAATRKGRTVTEMRKAVTALAEDGYGVKLTADEATAMADRILKAPADEIEVALRETTEALVDRARARRAVQAPTPFETPRAFEESRADATRITNTLRTRVQRLAQEVGYDMPKDEAGALAARLLRVPEPDALAILDELVVRPRTLAKTLAEPPPTVPADIPKPPAAHAPTSETDVGAGVVQKPVAPGVFIEGNKVSFEGAPRGDYIKRIADQEAPVPSAKELSAAIKATTEAEQKYYTAFGLTEAEYKRLGSLDRIADTAGGERADAAIREKKQLIDKLPPESDNHEFDLADIPQLQQLRREFESLERSEIETPAEHLDGMSRVLKRYINDVMDGDPFARAVFRKALDEARKAGFDTRQLTNDTMQRLFGDLSVSDRAFMWQEFENFMRPKVEAPTPIEAAKGKRMIEEQLGAKPANDVYDSALAEQLATPTAKVVGDPEYAQTMDREFQKLRAEQPDKEIPIGVDQDGNPITRTVEEAASDIEQRQKLAEEIRASCGPQPPPDEAANG